MRQKHIWEASNADDHSRSDGNRPQVAVCRLCGVVATNSQSDTCWGLLPPPASEVILKNVDERLLVEIETAFGGKVPVRRKVLAETYNNMIRAKLDPRKKKEEEES